MPPLRTLTFLFCATTLTYNLHWLLAGKEYCAHRPEEKYQWYARHTYLGWLIFELALVGEIWGVAGLSWREWLYFGHLGAIAVLYNFPEHRGPGWLLRLRRIPFLKIFLIAYLWATVGAGYPALLLNRLDPITLMWFAGIFLFVFAITLPFDIRDMEEDRTHELKTIPARWGMEASKRIALLSAGLAGVFMVGAGATWSTTLVITAAAILLIAGTHQKRSELYFTGLIDGLLVLFVLLVYTY